MPNDERTDRPTLSEPPAPAGTRAGVAGDATGRPARPPRSRVRFGLAARLSLALLGAASLVFVTVFYYDYRESRRHLLAGVRETVAGLSGAIVGDLQGVLADVAAVAAELAQVAERSSDSERWRAAAADAILDSAYCQGATLAIRADPTADGRIERALDCRYTRATKVICEPISPSEPPPPSGPATPSRAADGGFWSEPVAAADGATFVAVYTLPVYRDTSAGRVSVGAVGAKLAMADLAAAVERLRVFRSGYVFLLSGAGRYLAYPDRPAVMRQTIFDLARSREDDALRVIGQRMVGGETGFAAARDPYRGEPAHLYFTPLPGTGWSVGVVFPETELFADGDRLAGEVALIGGGGLLLLLLLLSLLVRRFVRPLRALTETSAAIAAGDLDVAIPAPRAADEVGVLTASFADMRRSLRRQMEILAATRAAGARLESELRIARAIQASVLPRDPAALARAGGLAVAAHFRPAREGGGDLYQCFWRADGRLFLGVGDVAGKGVPAALMMAVATTLIKAVAATEPDPAGVLRRVNRELCAIDEELLFVTLVVAALAPADGELLLGNAGHNPPLRVRADGDCEFLAVAPGLVLGVDPAVAYATMRFRLAPGETLLLYTDGVTEAMSAAGECYGSKRLLDAVRGAGAATPRGLVDAVVAAVAAHVGTADQHDDLTLLAVARLRADTGSAEESPPP